MPTELRSKFLANQMYPLHTSEMKRLLALFLVPFLILGVCTTPASAASPKAGSKCSSFGQSIIASGKKFTCLMVGSKQVWNKGVKVSGKTATAAAFKAPIPITLPVTQTGQITFSNILNHISEIPTTAYNNVQAVLNRNAPVKVPNSIFVGPTTTIDIDGGESRIQTVFGRTAQLWNGFTQPSFYAMYVYNSADEPATEKQFTSDFFAKGYDYSSPEALDGPIRALAGNCQQGVHPGAFTGPLRECTGADSGSYFNSKDSFLHLGQNGTSDPNMRDAVVIGHEYIHSVVGAQWMNSPNCKNPDNFAVGCSPSGMSNHGFSPCWINEGLPNAGGSAVAEDSLVKYLSFRSRLPFSGGPTTITDYTQQSLRDYLFNQSAPSCYQNGGLYKLGYSIGALATEALISIAGPQSVMAIYALGAEGQDFATAFKNVYGISWSDASTLLSKVLAAEYATYGSPPK